jgi:hypothetical protein
MEAEAAWSPPEIFGSIDMSFAVRSDVRFDASRGEETWMLPAGTFIGLDTADRQALSDWLDGVSGIDTVIDLAVRPWNIAGATAIFGVFRTYQDQASWLIVRHDAGWILADCRNGIISDISPSLPDILWMIDDELRA